MNSVVHIEIINISSQAKPPLTRLEYIIENRMTQSIWLVDDGWLIWQQKDDQIQLSYARGKLRMGAAVFGYFPPAVVEIKPQQQVSRIATLTWPQPLDQLWNANRLAQPAKGYYRVAIRIGYGLTPVPNEPEQSDEVESTVIHWQKEAFSQEVQMEVPAY